MGQHLGCVCGEEAELQRQGSVPHAVGPGPCTHLDISGSLSLLMPRAAVRPAPGEGLWFQGRVYVCLVGFLQPQMAMLSYTSCAQQFCRDLLIPPIWGQITPPSGLACSFCSGHLQSGSCGSNPEFSKAPF